MSGQNRSRQEVSIREPLGQQLKRLRETAGRPGWEVGAAAGMDATSLSRIERGERLPTQPQLEGLAGFFKVPLEPLERRRIAEEVLRKFGGHPELDAATAIVREEAGEYRAKKMRRTVNKPVQPVNKRKKVK